MNLFPSSSRRLRRRDRLRARWRAVLAEPELRCRVLRSRPFDGPDTDQRIKAASASLRDRASSSLDSPDGALVRLAIGIQAREPSATSPQAIRNMVRNHFKSEDSPEQSFP